MTEIESSTDFEPLVIAISFGMAFVSSFYIIFHVRESASKSKLLQMVSGLNACTFWLTSFLFDFITYMLTMFIVIITLVACQKEGWSSGSDLSPLLKALTLFGFATLPIMYVLSFMFSTPTIGFIWMIVLSIIINNMLQIITYGSEITTQPTLKLLFSILPHYALDRCLYIMNEKEKNDNDWDEFSDSLIYMAVTGIIFFVILFMIEFHVFSIFFYCISNTREKESITPEDIDDDIKEEKRKVDAMTHNDLQANNLVLRKLMKSYGKFSAVNQVSVAVQSAECFGILGENGAGKTSIFKMLTGDQRISSGEAFVHGIRLKTNMIKVQKIIGYCSQFDCFLEDLTGSETLEIFALLRGIRYSDVSILIERLASELTFRKHINKKIREYSGGNKRKLSNALALIGNPVVLFLDEPTTGIDPIAKRKLWGVLSKVRAKEKAIILSSHSMDECEALCTRLAIMVNGELKCLGSTQHLKNKFSKGFWLKIKMLEIAPGDSEANEKQISDIKDYIKRNIPGSDLSDEYQGLLTFSISTSNLKWSSLFGLMNKAKKILPIEDYSISQTSLEQVFLSLTKYQK